MAKKNYSTYGPDWNYKVVDREKKKGVSINGVRVSDYVDAHENFDARSAAQKEAAEARKQEQQQKKLQQQQEKLQKQQQETIRRTQQTKREAGESVLRNMLKRFSWAPSYEQNSASDGDIVRGMLGNLLGVQKKPEQTPAESAPAPQTAAAQPVKEGVGFGIAPSVQKQKNAKQTDADALSAYMAQTGQADFVQNSSAGSGDIGRIYLGPRYRYINDIGGMQGRTNGTGNGTFDLVVNAMSGPDVALARQGLGQAYGNQYRIYDQMTPDEISVLNYTLAKSGEKEAERYLKLLEPTLQERQAGETEQVASDLADTPVIGSIASVPLNAASAIEGGITMLAGIGGKDLTATDSFRSATRISSGIRDEISGNMTPIGSFFYQTGMSMLDTAFRLPFGGGGLAIAGLSAASQTAQKAIEDGASTEQALWMAGISGSLEVVTEKLSLDNLVSARAAGTLPGMIKAALVQGGIEASEETASALGNLAADVLIRKGDSAWNKEVESYIRAGMTPEEANKKTFESQMMQVASQAAGGFVSGLLFGGGGQIVNAYEVGRQQGASGVKAVTTGMNTVAKYDAAERVYKQAMKASPRYTSEERVAIARDIENSGMSQANKDGISKLIDRFAMQPQGWITEQGQALTEQAIQATRQAAEKNYVAGAQVQAKQTRALERLNTMFSDVQAAYKATQAALDTGDIAAHTKAVEATTAAIEKYNSAVKTEQADAAAQKAQRDADQRAGAETVVAAGKKLQAQLPAEIENHVQLVQQIEEKGTPSAANDTTVSAMGATVANDSAVLANETAVPANVANETTVLANDTGVSKNDGSASAIAQRFSPVSSELTGIGDQAEYDRVLQQAGMNMQFLRTDPIDPSALSASNGNSVIAYVSDSSAAGSGVIVPSVNDPKISETDLWEQFYHIQGDKNLRVVVPAIAERDKNGFVFLVKKGVIADQALTSTRAADNVSTVGKTAQAASAKPEASAYNIMSRIVNPGGVPRYQQTAQGANNAEFNIVNRIINGGNANGKQGENTALAGQTVSGFQQGQTDNGSGGAGTERVRTTETRRDIGSAGRGGSDRAAARGGQISAGASWNESNLTDLTQAAASINEELTRAGVAPLEEGDLVPYENLDQESAYWLKRMESLSGRKALIYTSNSGRTDIKNGFANNGREHVRYQPGRIMAFHFAHEIAENSAQIRAAGEKALRTIGEDSFRNYLRIKGAADADAETQRTLRKEFICDAYGAVMFDVISDTQVNDQLGISTDDYAEFQKAYIDHLAAPAISEEKLDSETRVNLRAGGSQYSSTEVSDPSTDPYAEEAMRLYNDHVTYEAYMEQQDADWRVGKQLYGMWNGLRKIRVMQRALDLFENNVTPTQYWEQNKTHWGKEGDQDNQVLNQLYGMYLRNDVPMGGRFGEKIDGQLETLLKNIGKARQYHALQLTGMAPSRVFENIAAYRKEDSLANIAANYRDGEQIRGAYHDFLITQNSSRAGYIENAREAVFKAFKGGTVRESNLAQLLGEKIVDKENLKQALYDGQHMLVRAIDGWFVFEHSGKLLAFCDGETTFFRDPKAYQNQKAANKAAQEQKTLTQKARERLQMKFTQVDKSVIRVKRTGNNAVIYIPGIKNPVQIQNGKAPNADIAIRTSEALASYYADAWNRQSGTLVENGYAPAKHIPDYFPHLGAEESGLNAVIESFVGYEPPTQIAGLTGGFKPGKPWAAHLQERTGPLTEFDAIRGFNQYVQKAGDVIFMTPAIQRLRQLESYLRENAGSKFDASAHSTLVEWLRKYTNGIANKKAELDRSAESLFGHEAFSLSNTVTKLISRSSVQGSLSSALSQTISYIAALPTLNPKSALKGTRQAIGQAILAMAQSDQYDKFEDKVPFLKARFGAYDSILEKGYQKADKAANDVLSWLFTAMDRFSTEAVARAKFDELRSRGRTEEQAGLETSAYCVKLFADRSKGMAPILFNNSVLRPFFQFQLEVANQMSHFRDIKRQSAAEAYDLLTNPAMEGQRAKQGITEDMMNRLMGNAPLTKEAEKVQAKIIASGNAKKWIRMVMYMVFLSLWGEFTRATMGRDQTWNPYGMAKDFIQDVGSDGVPTAVVNLGANALEQLPYASFATGGRVPIGTGVDKLATVAEDIKEGISEGDWQGLGKHALLAGAAFTPGGGQARKTITGKQAVDQSGYYTDKGELRYPVQQKDMVKSILFGPSAAAPEGYDWNDTLSSSKTDAYKSMIGEGIDPMAAYEMLQQTGSTNATKGLAILTTDSDGDGQPDFKGQDINIVASILGLKYDSKKDGSFESWTKKAAEKYVADAQKDGVTATEKKNIDAINLMMRKLTGLN